MLDESRRDDVMWLANTYDALLDAPASEERDADLARVQKWMCRVTGMSTVSGALAAVRRLTRHEVAFIAPVRLPRPSIPVPGAEGTARRDEPPGPPPRRLRRAPSVSEPISPRRRRGAKTNVVPPLDDVTAFEAEKLLDELDRSARRGLTAAERVERDALRETILALTGFTTLDAARAAVHGYIARREGRRRYVPTKAYAQDGQPRRTLPPVTIVRGGAPGSGSRR